MTNAAQELILWSKLVFRVRDFGLVLCEIDTGEYCLVDKENGEIFAPLDSTFSLGDVKKFLDELETRIVGKTQKEGR